MINGMTTTKAKKTINSLMDGYTHSIYHDNSWIPVYAIFDKLTSNGIAFTMDKSEYRHDSKGNPSSKTWYLTVDFINNNNQQTSIHGVIVACGCGSVSVPLAKYDLVAYFS